MAALLGEGPAAVRSAAAIAIAELVGSGAAGPMACYQGLFLQAAAVREGTLSLARDMLAEIAAEQPPADLSKRWTLTVRAIHLEGYDTS